MNRVQLRELINRNSYKRISDGETAQVFLLQNGKVLKLFKSDILLHFKSTLLNLEQKVLDSENVFLPKEIIRPNDAVYDGNVFVGYTMDLARGVNYNERDEKFTILERANLYRYADVHFKLERLMQSTPDIVYPDICTCDNIYVDKNDNIQLIDYDGFQVKGYPSNSISSTLGSPFQYMNSRKYSCEGLFTKELDKKSLILLYFLSTFNIDLNKVGNPNPYTGQKITLDDVFECINLCDYDIMNKVWKIFREDKENEYLGEDVFCLAQDYDMEVLAYPHSAKSNFYIKRLVRK